MSIGGGKGKETQTTADPTAARLADLAEMFVKETKGVRRGLIDQMQDILTTGGAKIPIISQAVEQTRRASSQALSDVETELARTGLSGTPFGEQISAGQRTSGELAASGTKADIQNQFLSMIPNFILGQGQTAFSGLSGAVGANVQQKGSAKGSKFGVSK